MMTSGETANDAVMGVGKDGEEERQKIREQLLISERERNKKRRNLWFLGWVAVIAVIVTTVIVVMGSAKKESSPPNPGGSNETVLDPISGPTIPPVGFLTPAKSWNQLGIDLDGEAAGDNSGYTVSLSGDGFRVAIGAPLNSGNGIYSGHTRIFQYVAPNWVQIGQDIDGEATGDQSG